MGLSTLPWRCFHLYSLLKRSPRHVNHQVLFCPWWGCPWALMICAPIIHLAISCSFTPDINGRSLVKVLLSTQSGSIQVPIQRSILAWHFHSLVFVSNAHWWLLLSERRFFRYRFGLGSVVFITDARVDINSDWGPNWILQLLLSFVSFFLWDDTLGQNFLMLLQNEILVLRVLLQPLLDSAGYLW